MDTEVLRDLRERDFWVTVQRDAYDVVSELLGIFCGHDDHPSRPAETSHVECHLLVQQAQLLAARVGITHHNDPAVDLNIYDQLLNNENTPA